MENNLFSLDTLDIRKEDGTNEIREAIDKLNKSSHTKELKDKQIHDIFGLFLKNISKALEENKAFALGTIILNESQFFYESTQVKEFPHPESFKITKLHKLSYVFYNYMKNRFLILEKNNKNYKEQLVKNFENISKLIESVVDNFSQIFISAELIYSIFDDYFNLYKQIIKADLSEEIKEKCNEDINGIMELIQEETNIDGLLKQNLQEESAIPNYVQFGTHVKILSFLVNKLEGKNAKLPNIENNLNYLGQTSFLLYLRYSLLYINGLFSADDVDGNLNVVLSAIKVFKQLKVFRYLIKSEFTKKVVSKYFNTLQYYILLLLICNRVKITKNVLTFLEIHNNDLINTCLSDSLIINNILKSNDFYLLSNFDSFAENFKTFIAFVQNKSYFSLENQKAIVDSIFNKEKQNNENILDNLKAFKTKLNSIKSAFKII